MSGILVRLSMMLLLVATSRVMSSAIIVARRGSVRRCWRFQFFPRVRLHEAVHVDRAIVAHAAVPEETNGNQDTNKTRYEYIGHPAFGGGQQPRARQRTLRVNAVEIRHARHTNVIKLSMRRIVRKEGLYQKKDDKKVNNRGHLFLLFFREERGGGGRGGSTKAKNLHKTFFTQVARGLTERRATWPVDRVY